jgi:hypothetical protein
VVEGHYRAAPADAAVSARANSNPVDFPVETVSPRFAASPAYTNDGFKVPRSYATHAVMDAELAGLVGITGMGSLVDQRAH